MEASDFVAASSGESDDDAWADDAQADNVAEGARGGEGGVGTASGATDEDGADEQKLTREEGAVNSADVGSVEAEADADAQDGDEVDGGEVAAGENWSATAGGDPDGGDVEDGERSESEDDGGTDEEADRDAAEHEDDEIEDKDKESMTIEVGSIVEVESRTWPGINKPGGSGRVAAVNRRVGDNGVDIVSYDVRYILGGFEKNIESEFVQLSWMVRQDMQKKRDPVARNYYHDAFIEEPLKKKREKQKMGIRNHTHSTTQRNSTHEQNTPNNKQRTPNKSPKQRAPAIRHATSSSNEALAVRSDDEDSFSEDDNRDIDADFEMHQDRVIHKYNSSGLRKLDKDAFLLNDRSNTLGERVIPGNSTSPTTYSKQHQRRKQSPSHAHNKATRLEEIHNVEKRTVENDSETQQRRHKKRKRSKRRRHEDGQNYESDSMPSHRGGKRHYVGGYHHRGDDPDANFIQPEDNPSALPEDVARETQFVLADSKEGLRKQAKERMELFTKHMDVFAADKAFIQPLMRDIRDATFDEIQKLHHKLSDMESFITKKLIRQGEDVINEILKKLGALRSSLPESVELAFGLQVQAIQEHRVWVRDAMASVESAWNDHFSGSNVMTFDKEDSASGSESDASSASSTASVDVRVPDTDLNDFVTNDYAHEIKTDEDFDQFFHHGLPLRSQHRYTRKQTSASAAAASSRRRSKVKSSSTSIRGYQRARPSGSIEAFLEDVVPVRTNFRQLKSHSKKQSLLDNKMFAWQQIVKNTRSKRNSTHRPTKSTNRGYIQSSLLQHPSTNRSNSQTNDTSGSVQAKARQLRNKRHQSPRGNYPHTQQPVQVRANNSISSYDRRGNNLPVAVPPSHDRSSVLGLPSSHSSVHGKRPRQESNLRSDPLSISEPSRTDWERVFEVLPDTMDTPMFTQDVKRELLGFGEVITQPSVVHNVIGSSKRDLWDEHFVEWLARLRQQLIDLRVFEFELLEQLPSGYEQRMEAYDSVEQTPTWKVLQSQGKEYHDELVRFCASVIIASKNVSAGNAAELFDVIAGIGLMVRQLPDCESMFLGCPEYFFYFDVEVPNARTTPLLSAVTRTYWYLIQLLVAMRSELRLRDHAAGFEKLVDGVSHALERVVDAAMLFLFDWYLYLPTSHAAPSNAERGSADGVKVELPALSLWMLLFNCFGNETAQDRGKTTFWSLFLKLCSNGSFVNLATYFIRQESAGGYLAIVALPNLANAPTDETQMSGMLLGLDSCWMITMIFDKLFDTNNTIADPNRWQTIKFLLGDKPYFLPFGLPASPSPLSSDLDHFDNFCLRVLERLVMLRHWLPSDQDTIKYLVPQFLENARPQQGFSILQLPALFKRLVSKVIEDNSAVSTALLVESSVSDALSMMCIIVWILISKPTKQVARRRFRNEVTNILAKTVKDLEAISTEKVNSDWIWGSKDKDAKTSNKIGTPQSLSPAKSTRQDPSTQMAKKQFCTSILLTTAVAFASEDNFDSAKGVVKDKKRENEVKVYCDEIVSIWGGNPELAVLSSQALFVLGSMLVTTTVEYVEPFTQLNTMLASSVKVASEEAESIPKWKDLLNENKNPYRYLDAVVSAPLNSQQQRFRILQSAVLSSLHLLRDLTFQLCSCISEPRSTRTKDELDAAQTAYASIIGTGLVDSFAAAAKGIISVHDMNIAIEILQLLLPRRKDEPNLSNRVAVVESFSQDEFHDDVMNDIYASLDLEGITSQTPTPTVRLSIDELAPHALELVHKKLRIELQKLLINYAWDGDSAFQELFVIDLFGRLLSEYKFHFIWSQVYAPSLKPRYIASRLFSATMKYNQDKEWLCNNFLTDHRAGQELANLWMMATVNTSTLRPTPLTFAGTSVTYSIVEKGLRWKSAGSVSNQIRDSNSWVVLTDSVLFHLLRKDNQLIKSKIDVQLFNLLYSVAESCRFPQEIAKNAAVTENSSGLYALHFDLFRAFAKSAGNMRKTLDLEGRRQDMNSLRAITLDPHRGIFPTFIEAYEVNIRNNCNHIEDSVINLSKKSEELLSAFVPGFGENYHDVDDVNRRHEAEKFGPEIEHLLTMLQFLYQCVDVLFFHCGELATGRDNLFTTTMKRLFRQATSAEFSQAQTRLENGANTQRSGLSPTHNDALKGVQPYVARFVQSVQVFFAQQRYPTLLHWFASTADQYQTFTVGWSMSPMRKLLLNVLDPDGPLGIHSFYPVEMKGHQIRTFNVKNVRREAFYLACGLFVCKCTNSFEHCHAETNSSQHTIVRRMREFVLGEFVRESLEFAAESCDSIDETLLPILQLLRAVLNHVNLNRRQSPALADHFSGGEIHASFEWIVLYFARAIRPAEAIQNAHRTVELIEFCGLIEEANDLTMDVSSLEIASLLDLSRLYLESVNVALSMTMTTTPSTNRIEMEAMQTKMTEKLRSFDDSSVSAIAGMKHEWIEASITKMAPKVDAFSVSATRARADLLVAVRRVIHLAP